MDMENLEPLENLLDEIRDIDGFPIADDEDILELSDPPYYTACPNPYINDFIEEYGTKYDPENDDYDRKPFVGDISEGKRNSVYSAHTYHTKVPHKAINKYIKHFTNKDNLIYDGFCGSGMTGIASKMSGRNSIISDLSPVASFIAYNYNNYVNINEFKKITQKILNELERECDWMYETSHNSLENNNEQKLFDTDKKAIINYTVWSEEFICPYCKKDFTFWGVAVNKKTGNVSKEFNCSHCDAKISKKECKRNYELVYDSSLNKKIKQTKRKPVLINYSFKGEEFFKEPDKKDLELLNMINEREIPYWYPTNRMKEGKETRRNDKFGITHVHHMYFKRSLWVISKFLSKIKKIKNKSIRSKLLYLFTGTLQGLSKQQRYRHKSTFPNMILSGTLYVGSLIREYCVYDWIKGKLKGILRFLNEFDNETKNYKTLISTNSLNNSMVNENSIDYIFTDPPFGENLMYSELNFIWESWLKVFTNNQNEAIVSSDQDKDLDKYTELMTLSFKEMYRILKPNRWMTVVFHNSKASVWNAIQESISRAGFIIAQVSTLDKKQGTFKQVTSAGAVKNDLVINAYKPKKEFTDRFLMNTGEGMEEDFIKQQLEHLPVEANIERTEKMLYSKMLAHYVENGFKIKYNANNFYELLHDNFVERDGYWFIEDQADEYSRWKSSLKLDELEDIKKGNQVLFVIDEQTALTWIYNFLDEPKDYSEIYTSYNQVATKTDDEIPELRKMLDNNFIQEDGKYRRPQSKKEKAQIKKNREKKLNKAWEKILDRAINSRRKIKNVRKEALIHGFTKCYQNENYEDIITVADRLYKSTLESSGDILDFVDIARMKIGD